MKITEIEKEDIEALHLTTPHFSLGTLSANSELFNKLKRATSLGNLLHEKVRISFFTDDDLLEVYTTIWATTENYIVLKGGRLIPIIRIIDVDFN